MSERKTSFRERVRAQEVLIGSFVFAHDPTVVRIAEQAGMNFLVLDYEHGLFSPELTARFIDQARHSSASILVRCTMQQVPELGALLDRGLTGVVVAGATSAEDVKTVLRTVKFPPAGNRGLNPFVPAAKFGRIESQAFMQTANDQTSVWVLAENRELLSELDSLCQLPELDGIFLGPYDLSISLGHPGELNHPDLVAMLQQTVHAVQKAGKSSGIFAKDAAAGKRWIEQGIRLAAVGFDWQTLRTAWANHVQELRGMHSSFSEV